MPVVFAGWVLVVAVGCAPRPRGDAGAGGEAPVTGGEAAATLDATFTRNLAIVQQPSASRVVLSPERRPYASRLVGALEQAQRGPRLELESIRWLVPTQAELTSCEEAFLRRARDDLRAGTHTLLPAGRTHALAPIFADFTRYERQAVGWSTSALGGEKRFVYLRFRLPNGHQAPITEEYFVRDGGHAYFEMQCALPAASLFAVVVQGES